MSILYRYRFAAAWAMMIFILSTANPNAFPDITFNFVFGIDKLVHFLLYAFLALLLILVKTRIKFLIHTVYMFLLSVAYGISIEILQGMFFAGRTFDYADIIANTIGAAIGVLIASILHLVKQS